MYRYLIKLPTNIQNVPTQIDHWVFFTPKFTLPKCVTPKCPSRQSAPRQNVPRQSAPRQSVLSQSAPHAKVPLTPKCPFVLICQSGIHANVVLCQSCTHAKVVMRQNVRVKVFHAKVFYAKMSASRIYKLQLSL